MKKKLFAFILALTSVFALCALTACKESPANAKAGNNVNVCVSFTADSSVKTLKSTTSVANYMDALAKKGELVYSASEGQYGEFIESVFGLKAEGNYFWAVYTDLVTVAGDDAVYSNADWGTYEWNGKTLNSAAYGVSALPCVEGYTYALVLMGY